MSAEQRNGASLAPLTAEERQRLESAQFDLRVAVVPGSPSQDYHTGLVDDLSRTGLFTEVGIIGAVNSPDLVATPTVSHGHASGSECAFSLHWSSQPESKVNVSVLKYNLTILSSVDWTFYEDRLALKVIDAMNWLKSAKALKELRPLAEQGNADAQRRIAEMYRTEQGVAADYTDAIKWYGLAATQGDLSAHSSIGRMESEGRGAASAKRGAEQRISGRERFSIAFPTALLTGMLMLFLAWNTSKILGRTGGTLDWLVALFVPLPAATVAFLVTFGYPRSFLFVPPLILLAWLAYAYVMMS